MAAADKDIFRQIIGCEKVTQNSIERLCFVLLKSKDKPLL